MRRHLRFLTTQEVITIHDAVLAYGGAPGLRDYSLLDSAVHAPQATYGDQYLYPTLWDMAAAYLIHLTINHPFVDANKRTAWVATRTFLRLNDFKMKPRRRDVEELMDQIAVGQQRDWHVVSKWIQKQVNAMVVRKP